MASDLRINFPSYVGARRGEQRRLVYGVGSSPSVSLSIKVVADLVIQHYVEHQVTYRNLVLRFLLKHPKNGAYIISVVKATRTRVT